MLITEKIGQYKQDFLEEFNKNSLSVESYDELKNKFLGRKGLLAGLFSELSNVPNDQKAFVGKEINDLKEFIQNKISKLNERIPLNPISSKDIDYTLSGDPINVGSLHPLSIVLNEIKDIFIKLGFSLAYGPEVETDFYNFDALNIKEDHPARDMQDTFYIEPGVVLRTHTSNTQIHTMLKNKPPIKIIAPGRVYRNEDISVRSYCLFNQVEGLYIDKNVNFSDLKGVLIYFAKEFFGNNVKTRFRPSYFPFTEPSAEMDISCVFCNNDGCNICKKTGWLEILGCGMVDPEVYKSVKINYEDWTGYAFGMGVERMTMLRYGIKDIRLFYNGDIRVLRQFR